MKPCYLSLCLLLFSICLPTWAQSDTNPTVENFVGSAVWRIQVSPERLFSSSFGRVLEDLIATENPGALEKMDAFSEALGFDPRTNVRQVLLFGDKFDETSATVVAQLGPTSGNLEGWFLAAPGYKSEDLDANTILHSFVAEDKKGQPRIWCAIPLNPSDKRYTLVATFNRDETVRLTEKISEDGAGWLSLSDETNEFLALTVNDLSQAPLKIDSNDPGSAIVRTIRSVNLTAAAEENSLSAQGELTASSPARAQQLQQLLMGLKAMVQLAALQEENGAHHAEGRGSTDREHKGAQKVSQLLNNLTVNHEAGSSTISAGFRIGYDELAALKNEMGN